MMDLGYMGIRNRRFDKAELIHILEGTDCFAKGRIKVYGVKEKVEGKDKEIVKKVVKYCIFFKKPELSTEDLKYIGKANLSLLIRFEEEAEIREKIQPLEKKPQLIIVGTEYEETPKYEITEEYFLTLFEQIRREKEKKQ